LHVKTLESNETVLTEQESSHIKDNLFIVLEGEVKNEKTGQVYKKDDVLGDFGGDTNNSSNSNSHNSSRN
jgi:hypothetical protein